MYMYKQRCMQITYMKVHAIISWSTEEIIIRILSKTVTELSTDYYTYLLHELHDLVGTVLGGLPSLRLTLKLSTNGIHYLQLLGVALQVVGGHL